MATGISSLVRYVTETHRRQRRTITTGGKGFYDHLRQAHEEQATESYAGLIERCRVRKFTEDEVEKLNPMAEDCPVVQLRASAPAKMKKRKASGPSSEAGRLNDSLTPAGIDTSAKRARREVDYQESQEESRDSDDPRNNDQATSKRHKEGYEPRMGQDGDDEEELPRPRVKDEVKEEVEGEDD